MKTTHVIIILGGGAAGLTVASGCAQLGMKTLLIEKSHMGGDCLHFGCVPSKTLLKSASLYHQLGEMEKYGLPLIDPNPVDLKKIMKRVSEVISTIAYHDSVERFEELGALVIMGTPRFLSPHEVNIDGKIFSGKKVVIATGSSPFIPDIQGLESIDFLTNQSIFNLTKLPSSLITIGGGPIGAELSQAFVRLGSSVTLLNRGKHILDREDEDMASLVEDQLKADGMDIENGVTLSGISQTGKMIQLDYIQKGEIHSLKGEKLLLAAGRQGNIHDLDLHKAGIVTQKSFIPVNNRLQTNLKHVYAIGDVNGQYLFTHVAGGEGSFVIRHAALGLPGTYSYSKTPWCTYTDPELASVGYNEKRAREAGLDYQVLNTGFHENDRAQAEGKTEGKIKILMDRKERLLGTQIAGYDGGNLILPSLYGMARKYKLMDILSPMLPYPTLGERQKKSAGSHYGPKLFNNRVKRILRLLYHYRG
jgi:pyruvate/2-oxoglutarate dehydrogenase complex dihydrolipoamide dehydrogenase (E3) component